MIVILSGKYVEQDLQAEFGKLPPAFLPVGNKRLYVHQVNSIRQENPHESILLTIPDDYVLPEWDAIELDGLGVNVLLVSPDLKLGEAIIKVLSHIDDESPVTLYYGDTLLSEGLYETTTNKNVMCYSVSKHNYNWLKIDSTDESKIFCGVFTISNHSALIKKIVSYNFNFEMALLSYTEDFKSEWKLYKDWLDFGHANTYYESKNIVTTQRAFNELQVTKHFIEKKSKKKNKLKAEAEWFLQVPENMFHYTPRLISRVEEEIFYKYKLEYIYAPTLSEIYVFGNQPENVWAKVIDSCFDFISECQNNNNDISNGIKEEIVKKNRERLDEFLSSNKKYNQKYKIRNGESYTLYEVLELCHQKIPDRKSCNLVHGDFCFSNILFDFKKNSIKVIDPRGIDFNERITNVGDVRYDLAKIFHSAIGNYDFIVSDRFDVRLENEQFELTIPNGPLNLKGVLERKINDHFDDINFEEIIALTVTLFLSMLPLHYDKPKRQMAFVATSLKLFEEFLE